MIVEPAAHQPKPLMKVPEVAALFEVDPETVRVWVRAGKLRARRTPGGRVLVFLRSDVEALLATTEELVSEETSVEGIASGCPA